MADLNALYSYQGQEPRPLPHEISYTESWGATNFRQGVESFTDEELKRAGYTGPYEYPSINIEYQTIRWDGENLTYVVEDVPDEELWSRIRKKRNRLLAECDWTMCVDIPGNTNNLAEWMKYRQRLRDITKEQSNPKLIVWPISPDVNTEFDVEPVIEDRIRFRVEDLEGKISFINQELESLVNTLSNLQNSTSGIGTQTES